MAKTPAAKKPKPKPKVKAKSKPRPLRDTGVITDPPIETEPCGCCDACASLPTGSWGLIWRDASGAYQCLEGPTVGVKRLAGDVNGPYWANP